MNKEHLYAESSSSLRHLRHHQHALGIACLSREAVFRMRSGKSSPLESALYDKRVGEAKSAAPALRKKDFIIQSVAVHRSSEAVFSTQ